jgi:RNA polymerase sigma factor (sigma-70 family)
VAANSLNNVIERLRRLASLPQAAQLADRELLERFVRRHDETAFTALVERHAPMVLRVCRRVLRHHQDAEDACQAAFLVLVRRAAAVRKAASLASWLHGVALRVALKLRSRTARTPRPAEDLAAVADPREAALDWSDVGAVLDEELERLPEKLRAPLILCYLEARTRDEAAEELGWKPTTLKGRLELGRKLLRQRLARRGLALSAALVITGVGRAADVAPAPLVVTVVRAGLVVATGRALSTQLVSARAVALADGFVRGLALRRLFTFAAAMVVALVVAASSWQMTSHSGDSTASVSNSQVAQAAPVDGAAFPGVNGREAALIEKPDSADRMLPRRPADGTKQVQPGGVGLGTDSDKKESEKKSIPQAKPKPNKKPAREKEDDEDELRGKERKNKLAPRGGQPLPAAGPRRPLDGGPRLLISPQPIYARRRLS